MALRPLSNELQEQTEKENNEVPSRVPEDLNHIREWILKQPHLKARSEDQWLLTFLRLSKFNLQETKDKIDIYYTIRRFLPQVCANKDPFAPEIQELLNLNVGSNLSKQLYPGGPIVGILRARGVDPDKITIETLLKFASMLFDLILLTDDHYAVSGAHVILDLEDFDYKYMSQVTPFLIQLVIEIWETAYPLKLEGVFLINVPAFGESIFKLFKVFLPDNLENVMHMYPKKDMDEFYKLIPKSILPKDYGGDEPSMDELGANVKKLMESHRDWFLEDAQYLSDERKRTVKPKIDIRVFRKEKSFKQLNID